MRHAQSHNALMREAFHSIEAHEKVERNVQANAERALNYHAYMNERPRVFTRKQLLHAMLWTLGSAAVGGFFVWKVLTFAIDALLNAFGQ